MKKLPSTVHSFEKVEGFSAQIHVRYVPDDLYRRLKIESLRQDIPLAKFVAKAVEEAVRKSESQQDGRKA